MSRGNRWNPASVRYIVPPCPYRGGGRGSGPFVKETTPKGHHPDDLNKPNPQSKVFDNSSWLLLFLATPSGRPAAFEGRRMREGIKLGERVVIVLRFNFRPLD